jgi:hypothetical protein
MRFCSLLLSVCIIANLAFVVSEKDDVTEDCHVGETGEVTCTSRKDGTVSESQTLGDDDDEYENNEEMEDDDEFLELAKKGANVVGVQSECNDGHELCGFWAGSGECQKNPKYMLENCRKSCNTCPDAKVLRGQSPVQHAENQKLLKLVERLFRELYPRSRPYPYHTRRCHQRVHKQTQIMCLLGCRRRM